MSSFSNWKNDGFFSVFADNRIDKNIISNVFLVSLFYGYQQLRRRARQNYNFSHRPELQHPRTISDTVSLDKFQEIRLENDNEATNGYSYAVVGNDDMVDRWVNHGIEENLLTGFWRVELDELVHLDRSRANQRLMAWLRFDQN